MDNGLPSLAAGKRRREGYPIDEDVKDNLKASRQWYGSQRADDVMTEGYQSNVHYSGLSMENLMRLQQQQQQMSEAVAMMPGVPHLNMQQRVEAAAALQDLRGITFQPQMQQHMKYGIQQQQQPQMQQALKTDASSLGDLSSNCQPPQSPLPLPPQPYIRTPPLHSEADIHNGSPTSSSSGPYPNLPNMAGAPRTSQQCSAPIQLPEPESDSSYSSLLHPSQSGLLAQPKAKNSQNGLLQTQQSSHSSPSGMSTQQIRGHSPQSGITQQADQGCRTSAMHSSGHGQEVDMSRQQAGQTTTLNTGLQAPGSHGMSTGAQGSLQNGNVHHQNGHNLLQNGVAFQHCGPTLPSGSLQDGIQSGGIQQQGGQVISSGSQIGNQLPQGGVTSLHQQQGRHAMPSSSHHQQGMHMPNGMMHPQGGHRMQDGMVQHQSAHMSSIASQCISNGALAHQPVQSSSGTMQQQQMGFPPSLRDVQGVQQNSWYPSIRDTSTISETQPSVSTSRLQKHVDAGSFVPMNGTMFSPAVTDLGSQRGLTTALPQLNQAQSGYRDVLPEQDRHPHGEGQSPLHAPGKVLPVQTDLQGRRFLSGNNFSIPSSSGAEVNLIPPGVVNGGLDDPALLQRTFMIPAPKFTRSYTKVYKLGSITRAVDVNRFSNYTELRCELARMFNLDGQLDQKLGWELVFTDNEDDLLLVGDDPWEEFVRNVRGIRILTPAEVYYYTNGDKCAPAAYNSTGGSAPKPM